MNARLEPVATPANPSAEGLAALEARLREDLERLCLPTEDWLARSDDDPVLDVAIVGGGMAGLAAAAQLWLLGVRRIRVFDRNPAGEEGPWVTHARMQTLRSPKHLVGPALGLPSLTFRAWYEAAFGKDAWDALDRIARPHWQDYLNWFRTVLALPVSHRSRVASITAADDGLVAFDVVTEGPVSVPTPALTSGSGSASTQAAAPDLASVLGRAGRQRLVARHLVLATGMDGLGGPAIPALADAIPASRWQHSSERIDFNRWRGRRLGVIGGGDSALDAAATALEAGARSVDVFIRAADFPRINYWKAFAHPGHYHGFAAMDPVARQPMLDFLKAQKVPPARGTVRRLAQFDNVRLHFDSPVTALAAEGEGPRDDGDHDAITVTTPQGRFAVDHLIFATGYRTDLRLRPELAALAPQMRFWHQRTPAHPASFALEGFPETAPDFSLLEREPGTCPVLSRVHLFTGAALMSVGKLTGDIPGISHGADRLARGIAARLYAEDFPAQVRAVQAYDELEVQGDEWAGIRAGGTGAR